MELNMKLLIEALIRGTIVFILLGIVAWIIISLPVYVLEIAMGLFFAIIVGLCTMGPRAFR